MNIGINFHETFPPTLSYISRLLSVSDGEVRSVQELSDLTGIPQGKSCGKVGAHLAYMMLMGLLEEDKSTLTALGQMVRAEDPACREVLTQWLLHANLTGKQGAAMWHYVYRELLPLNGGTVSMLYFDQKIAETYGPRRRPNVIRTCYSKGLSELNYLTDDPVVLSVRPQKIRREYLYLYAYDLLREWDACYGAEQEITAAQIETLQCAACFGLSDEEWFSVLETLASKGILRLNRQLAPYTVVRTASTDSVMEKIYSLLI